VAGGPLGGIVELVPVRGADHQDVKVGWRTAGLARTD
jgi:hypothetical protein